MRTKKALIVVISFLALFSGCNKVAESPMSNPSSSGIKFYGINAGNFLTSFEGTADGGYIFGGNTIGSVSKPNQGFMQKCDKSGNVEWYQTYGGQLHDYFYAVHTTSDGGFIAAGGAANLPYVVKANANGTEAWHKTFSGMNGDWFYDIKETLDNGFVAVGFIVNSTERAFVVKMDANGNTLWTQPLFAGYSGSYAGSVAIGPNGEIAIAATSPKSTKTIDQGTYYAAFSYLSASGKVMVSNDVFNSLGVIGNGTYGKLINTRNGFFYVVNKETVQDSVLIFYIDFTGNVSWHNQFYASGGVAYNNAIGTQDGGLLVCGNAIDVSGNYSSWLLNTDSTGKKRWDCEVPAKGYYAFAAGVVQIGNTFAMGVDLSTPSKNRQSFFGFMTIDQNGKIIENSK